MTPLALGNSSVTIAKGLHIDHYDFNENISPTHTIIDIPAKPTQEIDTITDIVNSGKHLAIITSSSKRLIVYDLPLQPDKYKVFELPRAASKIRFSDNYEHILVADKTGDALLYNIKDDDGGTKLLGHLSLLLDILQTPNGRYIITSDRDEKIKVSCYPNTYNIETYCLGHKEFVNHIEILPHDPKYLTSTSGDGHVKCWDYEKGTLCYNIDTYLDVNDNDLKESFTKAMDNEGVEVNTLPIVHYAVTALDKSSSLIAVAVHTFNKLLIYKLETVNNEFIHRLVDKVELDRFPASIGIRNQNIFAYDDASCCVSVYKIILSNDVKIEFVEKIQMFKSKTFDGDVKEINHDSIKVLYKRKFDNVQEYQERKKQRMEKSIQ